MPNSERTFAYKGSSTGSDERLRPLLRVSELELTRRFQQAYTILRAGGKTNPFDAFEEMAKLVFCKLWDERRRRRPGECYDFQIMKEPSTGGANAARRRTGRTDQSLLARIKALYEEGRRKAPTVLEGTIRSSAVQVSGVVALLEEVNLTESDLDSNGRVFETFVGSYFRGAAGQFFTPRPIVKFIVDVLPITHQSRVLDVACGTGGFLLHALEKLRRQEQARGASARDDSRWRRFARHNLYGIEINERVARAAKMNLFVHGGGHANIVACDGLMPIEEIARKSANRGFARSKFHFVITNPPFGIKIHRRESAYLENYQFSRRTADWLDPHSKASLLPSQLTEVLFIEQCWNFLADGGYLAMVVPDGVLNNHGLQYVRNGIEERFQIIAVVSLPGTTFSATGAGVKSSVLFLKKFSSIERQRMRAIEQHIQDEILAETSSAAVLDRLQRQRDESLAAILREPAFAGLGKAEIRRTPAYQERASEVICQYDGDVYDWREALLERYEKKGRKRCDYKIFMAIADDIGYDAAGRRTRTNELEVIAAKLKVFLASLEPTLPFLV